MEIKNISLHGLRKMNGSEGLVLQGAAAIFRNGLTVLTIC